MDGEIIGNGPEIVVDTEGEYAVRVENENACYAEDEIHVYVSLDLLDADFLIPAEAFVTDTVVLIDITWPEPDQTNWTFDDGIIQVNSEQYLEEIAFKQPGIYNIKLNTSMGMCVDSISKQITVLDAAEDSTDNLKLGAKESIFRKYKVYPNPNYGRFVVEA